MAEYRTWLAERARAANRGRTTQRPDADSAATQSNRKEDRRERAEARKAQAPLRKIIKDAETKLAKLEEERAKLESALADPALYAEGKAAEVTKLNTRLAALQREQDETEERWLSAQTEMEEAANNPET